MCVRVFLSVFRYCLLFLIFSASEAVAQGGQVGNEWIDFSQSYFRIPIAREGIYRLGFAELQAAGFSLGSVDPANIQLFHRGIQQAIFVQGEGDGTFDGADYIEFYGQKNDGTLDAELYFAPATPPHTLYNLYSDTTSYFLTVGTAPGKRMVSFSEDNTSGLSPEASILDTKLLLLNSDYSPGIDYDEGADDLVILNSNFDQGEGWTGAKIIPGQVGSQTITNIERTSSTGGLPTLELLVVGRGPRQHQVEIKVGTGQRLLESFGFTGYETHVTTQPVQWSDIAADGTLMVSVKNAGVGALEDWISASYIQVRYPQLPDLASSGEKKFRLQSNPADKSYITLSNPAPGTRLFDVTDPASLIRIGITETTTLNAIVSGTTVSREIYATNAIFTPAILPVSFRKIVPGENNYIIISNALLRTAALGYSDPVAAYAEYRASPAGGNFDTLVVNIRQLFDQFSYGESSPLAIYRFMRFMTNAAGPKYLLLIGRGLGMEYQYYRNSNSSAFDEYKDMVPFAGVPSSDVPYTAGLSGKSNVTTVPTGRIPALKSEDVAAYLDKVKEMEALPFNALWRKDVLHLSGGINSGEPARFKSYMLDFQAIAEGDHFGGSVAAIAKYSTEIVETINVAKQVNDGLNLLTYLGHSSPGITDFQIGYATDPIEGYHNKGRYPLVLFNGCYTGASHVIPKTLGEDWVIAKDKGAIGFIGHSAFGYLNLLKSYTETFYSVGYEDSLFIVQGIGDIQKETTIRYLDASPGPPNYNISQTQQMVLLGDPAVKLFGAAKADLEINENNVSIGSFDGQPVTAQADSFAIKMIVRNFGQSSKSTFRITVDRTLNDNTTLTYDSLYPSVKYSDTLTLIIRKGRESGLGNNVFRITLDPDDVIPEFTDENNTVTKNFFLPLNGTKNLFPSNYSIVHDHEISLAFQATDVLLGEREFIVEIDTAYTFDSPYKRTVSVKDTVLARQGFTLLSADTLAYYWRTRLAEDTAWSHSSFTYIENGPTGWAQVDFPQYLENQTTGLVKDKDMKQFRFLESTTPIVVKTFGSNHPAPFTDVSVKIADAEFNLYGPGYDCRDNSINLIAFDRKSTVPYTAVKFEWFNRAGRNCGRKPWVINNFIPSQMVTGNNDDIIQYVDNVPAGDSVVIYSIGDAAYSAWPSAAKIKLGELGISVAQIDALEDGEPVIIFARKGIPPGEAKFFVTETLPKNLQELSVSKTITGGYTSGAMHSTMVGPAAAWGSFLVQTESLEATDVVSFDVYGIKLNGKDETLILDHITGNQDLSFIDAAEYAYLKVVFYTEDETDLTAAQLRKWLITFTPVPEGLLYFNGSRDQVMLQEGETWQGNYAFANISDLPFADSLTVRYEVFNQTSRTAYNEDLKIKSPLPGLKSFFAVQLNTNNKSGLNDVDVFVNPRVSPEAYYDNNQLSLLSYLNVQHDVFNPVLDVTIDGRHVVNGDFVSPDPLIEARIWDENKYARKVDTTGIRIFLTYPCTGTNCEPVPVWFSDQEVTWFPATDTSDFRVEFRPHDLVDGEYRLRVEADDALGNNSGVSPFEVAFFVGSETVVSISDPYPNPFNEAVFLDITVRGHTVPDQLDFMIADVNGRQVSHLSQEFLPMHIGTNLLIWTGRNDSGSPVPNGVYVYKLRILAGGNQTIKFGKLVMLR